LKHRLFLLVLVVSLLLPTLAQAQSQPAPSGGTSTATATADPPSATPSPATSLTVTPTPTATATLTATATAAVIATATTTATVTATATATTAPPPTATPAANQYDVVVVGGTSAGVAAAVAAARLGARVALVEESGWLGGMVSAGGLGATDGNPTAISGLFEQFRLAVRAYYRSQRNSGQLQCYSPPPLLVDTNFEQPTVAGAMQAKAGGGSYYSGHSLYTWYTNTATTPPTHAAYLQVYNLVCNLANDYPTDGFTYEPLVAQNQMRQLLQGLTVTLMLNTAYSGVITVGNSVRGVYVLSEGQSSALYGKVVIDATSRGDVLADAGTRWQDYAFGRERSSTDNTAPLPLRPRTFDELDAGKTFVPPQVGESVGDGDYGLQAYSYLMTLVYQPSRSMPHPFASIADPQGRTGDQNSLYQAYVQQFSTTNGANSIGYFNDIWFNWRRLLPNNKIELNYADIPGGNYLSVEREDNYLTNPASRSSIEQQHRLYALSFVYWARQRVPAAQGWLPTNEYGTADGLPPLLYIREGNRMIGEYTLSERDYACFSQGCSTVSRYFTDSIATGQYALDSHTVRLIADGSGGQFADGNMWLGNSQPYQVPYRAIVPLRLDGLLVPLAASATHLGFGALRMEPVRAAMGQAAGVAAAQAAAANIQPRAVNLRAVQRELIRQKAATYTYIDVPNSYWAWTAISWLNARGVVQGTGPNLFAPNAQVRRAELAKMLTQAQGWPLLNPATATFRDVSAGNFLYRYVETAYAHGVISGYSDGNFQPYASVTREQMAKMLAAAAGFGPQQPANPSFSDVSPSNIFYGWVEAARLHGLMQGTSATTFSPRGTLTRAQAAQAVFNLLGELALSQLAAEQQPVDHEEDQPHRCQCADHVVGR